MEALINLFVSAIFALLYIVAPFCIFAMVMTRKSTSHQGQIIYERLRESFFIRVGFIVSCIWWTWVFYVISKNSDWIIRICAYTFMLLAVLLALGASCEFFINRDDEDYDSSS